MTNCLKMDNLNFFVFPNPATLLLLSLGSKVDLHYDFVSLHRDIAALH